MFTGEIRNDYFELDGLSAQDAENRAFAAVSNLHPQNAKPCLDFVRRNHHETIAYGGRYPEADRAVRPRPCFR